ncbi:uncharacterized protein LOC117329947 [Pecten maximus]|uniref:uncharacterized protein LOC117329947 n=1 Tax=Pecten maximus TaxID=6579 RepID=UPI0014585BE6|nr:uncharacterized protein LOC117329947 [Pecten maximus]
MAITSKDIILLVLMFLRQLIIVYGKTVDTSCDIIMDELDNAQKRFLFISTSNGKVIRCTYCSEETRKSSQAFLKAVEEQCALKNEGLPLKPDLSPMCKYMDPITCIIPNPIANGEWVCPCSGSGKVGSEEVLVYTNCTQQCKPGYHLVGDSFGHCGERWPPNKNYPTEFRYGNAECVKSTGETAQQANGIAIVVGACGGFLVFSVCVVLFCCYLKNRRKRKDDKRPKNRAQLQDIKSVSEPATTSQGTRSTTTTSLMESDPHDSNEDDSPWKLRNDATGVSCSVHLDNISMEISQSQKLSVLNKVDMNQKLVCYNMALDILKSIDHKYMYDQSKVESDLTRLCEGTNPIIDILFGVLKCYRCNIGHVADWCVRNGYESLVQCIVSEEHGKECTSCHSLLNRQHAFSLWSNV